MIGVYRRVKALLPLVGAMTTDHMRVLRGPEQVAAPRRGDDDPMAAETMVPVTRLLPLVGAMTTVFVKQLGAVLGRLLPLVGAMTTSASSM